MMLRTLRSLVAATLLLAGPLAAPLAHADSTVVFNEIMYHPESDEAALEWIELHNQMSADMDLTGWSLSRGVRFAFDPGTVLPGGGYLVIASDPDALEARTGFAGALGPFAGRLDNSGEMLELRNNNARVMDSVRYRDEDEWPVAPDGSGLSLAKRSPNAGSEEPANWTVSAQIGGTPGKVNFAVTDGGVSAPDGLVSWWRFDEVGSTARDSAGPNDGSLGTGATRVAGIVGDGALSFNNTSNAFVNVGAGLNGSFATTTGITVEAVLRPQWSGAAGDYDAIFRKEDGLNRIVLAFQHDGSEDDRDVPIVPATQPTLSFGINVGGVYSELDMPLDGVAGRPTLAALSDGAPHHVAATYDSASGLKAIWIDGALAFSATLGAGDRISSGGGSTAYIGNMTGRGQPFTGVIDEVAFWDEALASADVAAHAAAVLAGRDYLSAPSGGGGVKPALAFNEFLTSDTEEPWLELINHGAVAVSTDGMSIVSAGFAGGVHALGAGTIAPGARVVRSRTELGFELNPGDKLFLYGPARQSVIDAIELKEGLRGRFPEAIGPWLFPDVPTPLQPNSFALRDEIVINEIMYHQRERPATPAVTIDTVLVPIDAEWRYEASGTVTGNAWQATGFNDGAWPLGRALIYDEDSDLPAPKNTEISVGPIRFLFRGRFDFDGDPASTQLWIRPVIDDGAVFYLNGVEVQRLNMPEGPLDETTTSRIGVSNATFSAPLLLADGALVRGENVFAVAVHQSTAGSSDIVFGVELTGSVVIEEAKPAGESPESWIELYNKSDHVVELTGWTLSGGIDYAFTDGLTIGADAYLVVAGDQELLRDLHPGATIVGDFTRSLSNASDVIILEDAARNPVDEVRYFDRGRWPSEPDGSGASLELRDVRADNSKGGAWAASDEGSKTGWRDYSYRQVATANIGPTQWREFVFGLLDAGEVLLDDVSVIEDPDGAPVELLGNGSFESGEAGWRIIGTHRHSRVVTDPVNPTNRVLHLIATGATEHMHNHAETTLVGGRSVVNGRTYEVSFRVWWLAGSNQLNTRLYFNRVPRTTLLALPGDSGTPGRENSARVDNIGPTFDGVGHAPVVPGDGEPVTVTVDVADPDGVASCTLRWSVNGGAVSSTPMSDGGGGRYTATIPGQPASRNVQFWVDAADSRGARAFFPSAGPDSRALYRVEDGQARLGGKHNLRIIMDPADAQFLHQSINVMSNDRLGATVVYDESDVYYDVGVRLKGSERGRDNPGRVGFNIAFSSEQPFRGVHRTIAIDRSGGWAFGGPSGQDEILVKHMIQHAGGIPGMYDDIIRVIAPAAAHTGNALLQMARFQDVFLDSQWEGGSRGTVFEFELIYYPTTTDASGYKLPQPDGVLGVDLSDLGDDKEVYRWNWLIANNRDRDDYESLIPFLQVMSLSGAALQQRAPDVMDVDEWMRTFAMQSLCGIGDAYTRGNNHNLRMWVRPDDGRVLAFPWDWDFAFTQSTSSGLWGNQNLARVITTPIFQRLYYGHLLDIMNSTYSTSYMNPWIAHYGNLAERSYASLSSYIQQRANFVRGQLPAQIPFEITTNGGAPFEVDTPDVLLQGRGWIDVRTVILDGLEEALPLEWTSSSDWRATVPLSPGENGLRLLAYDHDGFLIGSDTITVTTSFDPPAPRIDIVTPPQGFPGQGIVVQGADFFTDVELRFDTTVAGGVTRVNAMRLELLVPALAPGIYEIEARNVDGDTSNRVPFTVLEVVPLFIRGDANLDLRVDVSDPVRILRHLFATASMPCADAGDIDDDEDLDITDPILLLAFLFKQGAFPPAPFDAPGLDPDGAGALDCETGVDPF